MLLVALGGWFDAAAVATAALHLIADGSNSVVVGEIDPDRFYDFTVARPTVEHVDGERTIVWPANVFRVVRTPSSSRDLVVFDGIEPHVAWPKYVDCVLQAVDRLDIGMVVTLGAVADTTPHTRPPAVVGSTTDRGLAATFGLAGPSYQGPTGVIGVLHGALETHGVPSVSLRVGVPGYLPEGEHPRSVAALVAHTAHVIGVALPIDLGESIRLWEDAHNAWVAGNERLRGYVELLEEHYDSRINQAIDDTDIAAHFEDFLRGADPDAGDADDGRSPTCGLDARIRSICSQFEVLTRVLCWVGARCVNGCMASEERRVLRTSRRVLGDSGEAMIRTAARPVSSRDDARATADMPGDIVVPHKRICR